MKYQIRFHGKADTICTSEAQVVSKLKGIYGRLGSDPSFHYVSVTEVREGGMTLDSDCCVLGDLGAVCRHFTARDGADTKELRDQIKAFYSAVKPIVEK